MIVIIGVVGFIGSCFVCYFNDFGYEDFVLVDDFSCVDKNCNLEGKVFFEKIYCNDFLAWFWEKYYFVDVIFYIGVCMDIIE